MKFSRSRFWSFVLLLLLPTLLVGAGSVWLLWREQARINEQAQETIESRKAAVEARTRLVAENIELLVLDVQSELMNTLHGFQDRRNWTALDELPLKNPLVRAVVRAESEDRDVVASPQQEARVLIKWFSGNATAAPTKSEEVLDAEQKIQMSAVSNYNAMQVSEVRSQLRQDAQMGNVGGMILADNAYAPKDSSARSRIEESKVAIPEGAAAGKSYAYKSVAVEEQKEPVIVSGNINGGEVFASMARTAPRQSMPDEKMIRGSLAKRKKKESAPTVFGGTVPLAMETSREAFSFDDVMSEMEMGQSSGNSEWEVRQSADGVHMFAMIKMPDGRRMGLELAMDVLRDRLMAVLPAELEHDERYVLRESKPRGEEHGEWNVRVPLSPGLMPGWEVAGFLTAGAEVFESANWFFPGMLSLVLLLLTAVLLGGMVLMRQARLSEEEAMRKTSFVANVSHELKTPLTTIRLYTELLEQGRVHDEGKRMAYLGTISSEAQRLARLVGNVLDFSRLEQGKRKYALSEVNLTALVGELLDTHELRVKDAGLDLQRSIPDEAVTIQTDLDAVRQIIINLLENACKYATDGGEVSVSVQRKENAVELCVADRGRGVPLGQRERIFEKFHRVDDRLTSEKTGTGLGLSIARQLARGLGGDLRYAERKGGGAEFILTLPIRRAHSPE